MRGYYKKAKSIDFGWCLVPCYLDQTFEKTSELKLNTVYRADVKKPRNSQFHRLVFGNISHVYSNTEWQEKTTIEAFTNYVKIKAALLGANTAEIVTGLNGEKIAVPVSLSFDNMDQDTFSEIWEPVASVLVILAGLESTDDLYYQATEELLND